MKWLGRTCFAVATLVLLAELGVRLAGLLDVPLFVIDPVVGYLPAPNQQGSFMRRHAWAFNELSMGTSRPFKPGPERNILLVGDSVVYGGPHYAEAERLGPLLEHALPGSRVWPLAAGSWATRNELAWLRQHPEVVRQVDDIVFVTTSEDFTNEAASWHCESNNPTIQPWLALWFLAAKKWQLERCDQTLPQHKVPDADTRVELLAWLNDPALRGKRLSFVLYPFKGPFEKQGAQANQTEREFLRPLGTWPVADLAADANWHAALYKDDAHPSPQGNAVLASFIARALLANAKPAEPEMR
jgi:lysophospholipase L1-like esterase